MIVSKKLFLKLRIDFIRFVITGPSTTSTSEVRSFPIKKYQKSFKCILK